jgi:hypothetical protein
VRRFTQQHRNVLFFFFFPIAQKRFHSRFVRSQAPQVGRQAGRQAAAGERAEHWNQSALRRKAQPSVKRALPPVGWHSTVLHEPHITVVLWKRERGQRPDGNEKEDALLRVREHRRDVEAAGALHVHEKTAQQERVRRRKLFFFFFSSS